MIFWTLKDFVSSTYFFSSATHSSNSLSHRLRPFPLHTCLCQWWMSRNPGISTILGSIQSPRLNIHPWPLGVSFRAPSLLHGLKAPQLYVAPSCLLNQHHMRDSYMLPSSALDAALACLDLLCAGPIVRAKHGQFHVCGAGPLVVEADSSAPADH